MFRWIDPSKWLIPESQRNKCLFLASAWIPTTRKAGIFLLEVWNNDLILGLCPAGFVRELASQCMFDHIKIENRLWFFERVLEQCNEPYTFWWVMDDIRQYQYPSLDAVLADAEKRVVKAVLGGDP